MPQVLPVSNRMQVRLGLVAEAPAERRWLTLDQPVPGIPPRIPVRFLEFELIKNQLDLVARRFGNFMTVNEAVSLQYYWG